MYDTMMISFELWAEDKYCLSRLITDLEYDDPETQMVWEAWQGSRESLIIELPHDVTHVTDKYFEDGRDAVLKELDRVGVKYQ